ncbi:MAG TPA: tetratricopeptide repeat protein [Ignavibacteriaceae bacterium]|nr:tetratricopeptide repeat protein [Ignavibacteriaceae bacterium]
MIFYKMKFLLISFLISLINLSVSLSSPLPVKQTEIPDQENQIVLIDTSIVKITEKNYSIPIWILLKGYASEEITIRVLETRSHAGEIILMKYSIRRDSIFYRRNQVVASLTLIPDSASIMSLSPGRYNISILTLYGEEQSLEKLSFEIPQAQSVFSFIEEGVEWIRSKLLTLAWYMFEIIIFLIILIILFWFFIIKPLKGSRGSLNVLPIINETGNKDYDGVASGIDDIFMTRLRDIAELGKSEELKQYWLADLKDATKGRSQVLNQGKIQELNIAGGEVTIDFQKLGDISIGPVKIPLGAVFSLLLKIFGGKYISGALQQYGSGNKLILSLESRFSLLQFWKSNRITYFEASWPSETIKEKNLSEGIPYVLDQLTYMVILNLTENVGTSDWQAYKNFLDGNYLFGHYEKNKTRKDLLRDAIDKWRISVRFDPQFAKSHYNLGVALDMDDLYPDAVFRYQKAIELSPQLIGREALYNLAKIYWDIYKDEQRTLAELEKIKEIDPNLFYVYNLEGLIKLKQQNYQEAMKLFSKSIELSLKQDAVLFYNKSVALYNLNKFDEAEENGLKAIEILPKDKVFTDLLQTMGWIHNRKGERELNSGNHTKASEEFKKAAEYFRHALFDEPERQALLDGYGEALRESGSLSEAFVVQKRLLKVWPEYSRGYIETAETMKKLKFAHEEIQACIDTGNILRDPELVKNVVNLKVKVEIETVEASVVKKKLLMSMLGKYYYYLAATPPHSNNLQIYEQYLNSAKEYLKHAVSTESVNSFFLDAELHQMYGTVLSKLNEFPKAIDEFNFALNIYAITGGSEYDSAVCYSEIAKNFLVVLDYNSSDINYRKSADYYKKAGYKKYATNVHLEDAKVLMEWYWNKGDRNCYEWARQECDKAIMLNHTSSEAYHVKGNTYYDFQKYTEAVPQYEIAVELNYNLPGAHYNLGLCYKNIGNYERAVKNFETVIKLDPFYADAKNQRKPDPYQNLAGCFELMNQPDKAVKLFKHVVNLFPSSAKYSIILADYLAVCGDVSEAVEKYKSAMQIDPLNEEGMMQSALNNLANIYLEQGVNFSEAERMVNNSLNLCRKDKTKKAEEICKFQNTLGWICFQKSQYKRAITLMEKTLPVMIDDQRAHARLALAYEKFSETIKDQSEKKRIEEKFFEQWNIVKSLEPTSRYGLIAEQRIKN